MIPIRALLCAVGLLAWAPASPAATDAQGQSPEALVTALYKLPGDAGPFFQTKSRKLVGRYFAKPVGDLIWKDAQASQGEVGAIDGSPIYDAQDYEPKALVIHPAKITGARARVEVTFTNYDDKKQIVYELVQTDAGEWRIADIRWAPDRTLLGVLKAAYPG